MKFKFKRQHLVIILPIIIIIVLVCTTYLFGIKPKNREIEKVESELREVERDLDKARIVIGKLERLKAECRWLEFELREVERMLPKKKEMAILLKEITRLSNITDVDITSFRPRTPIHKPDYSEFSIDLELEGTYHGICSFLNKIGNIERIINPTTIRLSEVTGKKGKTVSCNLTVTTYYKE
ncbi:MAG: type 4a pilus biogenesis protein PilO [bacterium]|nr:type 4a pilus biogenesis protein PilO [bacterium]